MRSSKPALAAILAMAAVGAAQVPTSTPARTVATAEAPTAQNQPASGGKYAPGDTKAARLGTGYLRRWRAPVGKRYAASVRQHQRHAAKRRNVRRHRAAVKG